MMSTTRENEVTERQAAHIAADVHAFAREHHMTLDETEALIHHLLLQINYRGQPQRIIHNARRAVSHHPPRRFHRGRYGA